MGRRQTKPTVVAASVNCAVTLRGNRAFLSGEYPLDLVREVTSYYMDGYRFAPAYNRWIWDPLLQKRRRAWDGRCHLFEMKTRSMPAGLTKTVTTALREADDQARVLFVNDRLDDIPPSANDPAGFQLREIAFGQGKFDYQMEAAKAAIGARQGILKIATNGGKTEIACAIAGYLRLSTLFIVPGIDLLHQTRKRFAKRLGLPIDQIGIIGDGSHKIGDWITIATVDSLHGKKNEPELRKMMTNTWQLLFVDECHTAGSDTFYEVLDCINAFYRFGLSGTPLYRTDGGDLRLIAQTGDIIFEVSNKFLIERGISVPVEIEFVRIDQPKVHGKEYKSVQKQAVTDNEALNGDIVRWVPQQLAADLQVVIMLKEIAHGKRLEQRLLAAHSSVKFLHGGESTEVREQALADFSAGKLRCLIGTSILYQGIDTPAIDVLVLADLGRSRIALLQALGRGLRAREGKTILRVRDYANFCHKWFSEHSLERLKTYKKENCFKLIVAT